MAKSDVVVSFKRPFADGVRQAADAAACSLSVFEDSKTVQSAKDDADINVIVRRFAGRGELPVAQYPAKFGDFSSEQSYHEAMTQVVEAKRAFMELPADVRSAFSNDPGALIRALEAANDDPEVRSQLEELGLVNALEAVAPADDVPVVAPVAPPAAAAAAPAAAPPAAK